MGPNSIPYFFETLHKSWSYINITLCLNSPNSQETADLVTFTEKILNGKLHFLWSEPTIHSYIKMAFFDYASIGTSCKYVYVRVFSIQEEFSKSSILYFWRKTVCRNKFETSKLENNKICFKKWFKISGKVASWKWIIAKLSFQ